ncbi:unnamed protein product [Rotaria sordida]|uniref:Transposase n=1 Tax=Rotaria sordida TaxID=392033 RepID=A0A815D865_9BILA|nr:unnamed protein product [Rotaria sordida]CAF3827702.1 unnamed protein product [Rotaria sordida]
MNSATFNSDDEIYVLSSADRSADASNISSPGLLNDSTPPSNSYTSEQLNHFLLRKNENFRLENNNSTKILAPWWRAFGYITVKNKKKEFERINGFISCVKCYHTFRYGPASGTKHFVEHADRCFSLISSNSATDGARDSKLVQSKLNQVGFRPKTKLTLKEKKEFKELCAKWVCTDLRPFTIVEDYGFERLASMFIKIGAEYGLVDVKELLPSRQTVSRTVDDLAAKYRIDLKEELYEPLRAKAVTIAPDFWMSKYSKQSFLGVSATYINSIFQFKTIDLLCRSFNGIKSYDLILEAITTHLSDFGITNLMNVNIITDCGSNFIKCFAQYEPLYCFGHRLNNILKTCFFQQQKKKKKQIQLTTNDISTEREPTLTTTGLTVQTEGLSSSSEFNSSESEQEVEEEQQTKFNKSLPLVKPRYKKTSATANNAQKMLVENAPPEAKQVLLMLKQAKKLVKYVKLVGMNTEIKQEGGVTLHQSTVVGWLTLSDLLESIIKSFKVIRKLLTGKEKYRLITDLNLQYLKQLYTLLKSFKHIIVSVQKGNAPSLYLVPMCYITLKQVLQSFEAIKKYNQENIDKPNENQLPDDSTDYDLEDELPGIRWFRERLLILLNEMIILDIRQVAATLLHPKYRSLRLIPDYIKDQCHKYVRQQVTKLRDQQVETQNQQPTEPPTKRIKRNIFTRFESGNLNEDPDDAGSGNESDEYEYDLRKNDELDRYLSFKFDKDKETTEALQFWKDQQHQFPFLSKYARSILSIPATTTNVEREFSTAGWILNERRTSLQPDKLENILLVRSAEKYLYEK